MASRGIIWRLPVGNCICAVVLSGVATDGDQSDSREAAGGWNGDDVRAVGRRLW